MLGFFRSLIDAYASLPLVARVGFIALIAILTTAGGLAVLVRLPADHFTDRPTPLPAWQRHPVVRIAFLVAKNLLGVVVLPLGILMSVPLVPGPGLVFIILGLSLLNFPGKRALERKIVRRPFVINLLNQTRARFGRPPFEVAPD